MDLKTLNICSLRDEIGIVSQEPILFDGTLEENILLGSKDATREHVIQCCKIANAYEFIAKMSDGICTRVGFFFLVGKVPTMQQFLFKIGNFCKILNRSVSGELS